MNLISNIKILFLRFKNKKNLNKEEVEKIEEEANVHLEPECEFISRYIKGNGFHMDLFFNKKIHHMYIDEDQNVKFVFVDNTKFSFRGQIEKNIQEARPGSIWIEGENFCYIDSKKNKRTINAISVNIMYNFGIDASYA
ncbi:MAG: hypothetical protein K0R18_161 [Bacillales bacterium]|jgi:hypothetical protein|nr:hypothetical protein [Bacillales bacterium]